MQYYQHEKTAISRFPFRIYFTKKVEFEVTGKPVCFINKLPLPFNDLKYLGNVLQRGNSMTIDCNKKRAIFITKIHFLKQEFYFNSPDDILKL